MKHALYFKTALIFSIAGFFTMVLNGVTGNFLIVKVAAGFFIAGIAMYLHWNYISFNWKCSGCGQVFSVGIWENIKGINRGIDQKLLTCRHCHQKGWCAGVEKNNV